MPLVLDLREQALHWLDVQSKGQVAMNNVATTSTCRNKVASMHFFASASSLRSRQATCYRDDLEGMTGVSGLRSGPIGQEDLRRPGSSLAKNERSVPASRRMMRGTKQAPAGSFSFSYFISEAANVTLCPIPPNFQIWRRSGQSASLATSCIVPRHGTKMVLAVRVAGVLKAGRADGSPGRRLVRRLLGACLAGSHPDNGALATLSRKGDDSRER
jgi:hypothetical protein